MRILPLGALESFGRFSEGDEDESCYTPDLTCLHLLCGAKNGLRPTEGTIGVRGFWGKV